MHTTTFALTLRQRDIYWDQLRHVGSPLYNIGGYIQVEEIDIPRLIAAHRELICGNEIFGLRILSTDEGVSQYVSPTRNSSLKILDFSKESDPHDAAANWMASVFNTPFRLESDELFAAYCLKVTTKEYRYVGLAHHIVMDGWGFSNWARRLCQIYNDPLKTSPINVPWQEIVVDDEVYLGSPRHTLDEEYWGQKIRDRSNSSVLFTRKTEPQGSNSDLSKRKTIEIPRDEFNEMRQLSKSVGATAAHHVLALLSVYLSYIFGQEQLTFGISYHNRPNYRSKHMLGVFVGVCPLNADVRTGICTFGELVGAISRQQKSDLRHLHYPLGDIIRQQSRTQAHTSLYEVGFNDLNLSGDLLFGAGRANLFYVHSDDSPIPLMITLCDYGESRPVELQFDHNLSYLDDEDMLLMAGRLRTAMQSARKGYGKRIVDLQILPDSEISLLLGSAASGTSESPTECLHTLFEKQADSSPDSVALVFEEHQLSYSELNEKANQVAARLRKCGVGPNSLIGLCVKPSVEMIVGILGILKAGGAYVPLDPLYPTERLKWMMNDSGPIVLLTQSSVSIEFLDQGTPTLLVDAEMAPDHGRIDDKKESESCPQDLAYVIYTSGSTGTPKGVMVEHQHVHRLLLTSEPEFRFTDQDVWTLFHSYAFDFSVWEIWGALLYGGRLVIVPKWMTRSPGDFRELLQREQVTVLNQTPTAFGHLDAADADAHDPLRLRVVVFGGEALKPGALSGWVYRYGDEAPLLINMYGITETTVHVTYRQIRTADTLNKSSVIGRPLSDLKIYLFDAHRRLVPYGSPGEMYVSGQGVARGYLNRDDMTRDRFIDHPSATGERLYKTGDLARLLPNGELEYLGRIDDQVKIRGHRIELGEIESRLMALPDVAAAVVLVRENDSAGKQLVAYVVQARKNAIENGQSSASAAVRVYRNKLSLELPDYMVPAQFVLIEALPLTANGKIDKEALLARDDQFVSDSDEQVLPVTPTEVTVVNIWANLLGIDGAKIGTTAGLLEFGGHSLLLVRLVNQVHAQLGVKLSLRTMFEMGTLRDVARIIDAEVAIKSANDKMKDMVVVSEGYL